MVQPPPPPVECDDGEEFYVAEILDHQLVPGTDERKFLIRWQGHGPEHNSWEPESEVGKLELYTSYIQRKGLTPRVPDSDDE